VSGWRKLVGRDKADHERQICRPDMPGRHASICRNHVKDGPSASAIARAERARVTEAVRRDPGKLATRREHVPLGVIYMVGATIVFAISSATSKWLVASYPVGEVLFTRAGFSLIACALVILPQTGLAVFHTNRRRDHVMRSLSQTFSQTFLMIAFSLMPLASAVAINFSSPLFTTLVAIMLLNEKVGFARWFALIVGFLGVLIVTNPGADTFQVGALFALANAMIYGSVTAAVRGMTATESAETLLMYQLLLITIFFSLMLPFGFAIPTAWDAGLMLFNGLTNAIGQYWWTRALHLAPASAVTPFFYLSLIWAALLGYVVWGDLPTVGLLVGSAVVVGSGLFLLWRESVR
jgi:drug/metabolite transporter (DMT)-like permease